MLFLLNGGLDHKTYNPKYHVGCNSCPKFLIHVPLFQIDEANLRYRESMDDDESEYAKQESKDDEAKDKEEAKSGAGNY